MEDTDAKREVPGAAQALVKTLARYGVHFDEGVTPDGERGDYGPYKQSNRAKIYHVFAKSLVQKGLAYPCFTTEEDMEALRSVNKKEELKNTNWLEAEAERDPGKGAGDHLGRGQRASSGRRAFCSPDPCPG